MRNPLLLLLLTAGALCVHPATSSRGYARMVDERNMPFLEHFEKFLKDYGKDYADEAEKAFRMTTFVENLKFIASLAGAFPLTSYTTTNFTDWTDDELKLTIMEDFKELPSTAEIPESAEHPPEAADDAPSEVERGRRVRATKEAQRWPFGGKKDDNVKVDWRKKGVVSSVKNQGKCGSCWAFSTISIVESALAIDGKTLGDYSEQQLMDCSKRNHGCNGGNPMLAMMHIRDHGVLDDDQNPYTGKEQSCKQQDTDTRIASFARLRNKEEMESFVEKTGPIAICIWVQKSIYFYEKGVYKPSKCEEDKSLGGHAMTAVGYGEEQGEPYWLIKNSWGERYGDKGYMKIARGSDTCGIEKLCPSGPLLK